MVEEAQKQNDFDNEEKNHIQGMKQNVFDNKEHKLYSRIVEVGSGNRLRRV